MRRAARSPDRQQVASRARRVFACLAVARIGHLNMYRSISWHDARCAWFCRTPNVSINAGAITVLKHATPVETFLADRPIQRFLTIPACGYKNRSRIPELSRCKKLTVGKRQARKKDQPCTESERVVTYPQNDTPDQAKMAEFGAPHHEHRSWGGRNLHRDGNCGGRSGFPCSGQRPLLQALPGSPGASPYRLTPDNYDSRMSALSGPGETSDSAEFLTWSVRKINANPDRAESAWLGDSLFRQAAMRCRSTARRGIRQGGRRVWKATYGTVWPAFGGSRQQYGQSHVCL
jgi:hypothetical protein